MKHWMVYLTCPMNSRRHLHNWQRKWTDFYCCLTADVSDLSDLNRIAGIQVFFTPETDAPQVITPNGPSQVFGVALPADPARSLHYSYPLFGMHLLVKCDTCHAGGNYQIASSDCSTCHADNEPQGHYSGDCSTCHNPAGWVSSSTDQASTTGIKDCKTCDERSRPEGHSLGECSLCHNTDGKANGAFVHPNTEKLVCTSCHAGLRTK